MADRSNGRTTPAAPSPVKGSPSASSAASGLHIDSLHVRIPGRDKAAGQKFASELSERLATFAPALLASDVPRRLELGTLRVSLNSSGEDGAASSVSSAIENAILRAVRAARHDSDRED